jgi:hypothetical protein
MTKAEIKVESNKESKNEWKYNYILS